MVYFWGFSFTFFDKHVSAQSRLELCQIACPLYPYQKARSCTGALEKAALWAMRHLGRYETHRTP